MYIVALRKGVLIFGMGGIGNLVPFYNYAAPIEGVTRNAKYLCRNLKVFVSVFFPRA